MVVRRTIENLRERPRDQKNAIATGVALAVVAILFLAWVFYFFQTIRETPGPDLQNATDSLNSSGLQQAQQQLQQAYGSTTQFVDVEGNTQVEQLATSTQPTQ